MGEFHFVLIFSEWFILEVFAHWVVESQDKFKVLLYSVIRIKKRTTSDRHLVIFVFWFIMVFSSLSCTSNFKILSFCQKCFLWPVNTWERSLSLLRKGDSCQSFSSWRIVTSIYFCVEYSSPFLRMEAFRNFIFNYIFNRITLLSPPSAFMSNNVTFF